MLLEKITYNDGSISEEHTKSIEILNLEEYCIQMLYSIKNFKNKTKYPIKIFYSTFNESTIEKENELLKAEIRFLKQKIYNIECKLNNIVNYQSEMQSLINEKFEKD